MTDATVLLVEDNEGDIVLTTEALQQAGISRMDVVRDGQEAIDYLENTLTMPRLVLLDINLPKIDGLEVLALIKQSPRWRSIPVIILTTSSSERDIETAYDSHANCYVVKNPDLESFMKVMHNLRIFWFETVKLPE